MKKNWKVELRDTCKNCGGPLPNARYRTFCSKKCRCQANNKKQATYRREWQKNKRDEVAAIPSDKKLQCLICGKWYTQVSSHAYQIHGLTGREYREKFELEVKRGVVPAWYRKLKGDQALDNQTFKNLEAGAKFRFKEGQKGVGVYKRSPVTLERLKNLHKLNKNRACTDRDIGV